MRKNTLYSTCQKNTTDIVIRPTYFKYINFGTTYCRSAHFKDFSSRRQSENTKNKEVLYTENTLHWRKIEMVNAPWCSITHPVHPKSGSFLLSYLLRRQSGKNTKYDRQAVDKNTNGKKQSKDSTGKIFLQKKGIFHHKSLPLSNCLLSVDHAAILCCWPISSLADFSRMVSCDVVALLLSSIPSG